MVVRKSVPSLAYFTAEWAWDGPAHVHLNMPPHLILLLHHLLTLETLVPRLPLPIPDLRNQLVKPRVELWEKEVRRAPEMAQFLFPTFKSDYVKQYGHEPYCSAVTGRF